MAYVFDKINNQLDGEKQQGTDIFGQQQLQVGPEGQPQPGAPQAKTSTEGEVSGAAASGTAIGGENVPQEGPKQDQRAIKRNIGKVAKPQFAQNIDTSLGEAEKNLQTEADQYVQGARAKDYGATAEDMSKAVGGDQGSFDKLAQNLGASADLEVAGYGGFRPQTDIDIEDTQNLRTSQGVSELLRREAGPVLSQREIDFDRMILERSPEFINIKNQLIGRQANLSRTGQELSGSKSQEAEDIIRGSVGAGQKQIQEGLGGIESGLRGDVEARVAQKNAEIEALKKAGVDPAIVAQAKAQRAALAAEFDDKLRLDAMLQGSGEDVSKYLEYADPVTFKQMLAKDEAEKFNRISAILGRGGDIYSEGAGAGDLRSFDEGAYRRAVTEGAQSKRKAEDISLQKQIDAILSTSGQVAALQKSRREKDVQALSGNVGDEYKAALAELQGQYGDRLRDYTMTGGRHYNEVDPMQYAQYNQGDFSSENFLDAGQAKSLNALMGQLGQKGVYSAGNMGGPLGSFNAEGYKAALRSLMEGGAPKDPMTVRDKIGSGYTQFDTSMKQLDEDLTGGTVNRWRKTPL